VGFGAFPPNLPRLHRPPDAGEDVVELHCHGGNAVRRAVEGLLSEWRWPPPALCAETTEAPVDGVGSRRRDAGHPGAVPQLRTLTAERDDPPSPLHAVAAAVRLLPAPPGEFTRRAVANGKMDVTAAEGLADLLAADTEAQRAQAMAVAGGGLHEAVVGWRTALVQSCARLEACIDFGDDEFIPPETVAAVRSQCSRVADELEAALRRSRSAEVIREGYSVAIIGPANAGKSSLLNTLARRPVAIVSDIPGTTRDVLAVTLDVEGLPVVLHDTAGLRAGAGDAIEAIGMGRTKATAAAAHLLLVVVDVCGHVGELAEVAAALQQTACDAVAASRPPPAAVLVLNKTDTVAEGIARETGVVRCSALADAEARFTAALLPAAGSAWAAVCHVSATTGAGVDALLATLRRLAGSDVIGTGAADGVGSDFPIALTRPRHKVHAAAAAARLRIAAGLPSTHIDMMAEEVRAATTELATVVGDVSVDDVLDALFGEFCIGK
jgi:tRNA modification GTPase